MWTSARELLSSILHDDSRTREIGGSSPPDLLLTDVVMPQLSGPELAQRVRALRPTLPVIFCSGYLAGALGGHLTPGATVIAKPFTSSELLAAVGTAVGTAVLAA